MHYFSPLGMHWRPYYYERVINAISNIVENTSLSFIGFTSWTDFKEVSNNLANEGNVYLVSSLTYLLPTFLYQIFGNFEFLNYINTFDYFFISLTGFFVAELGLIALDINNNNDQVIYGVSIFSLFLTSPWTYRMIIAPWHEVSFLAFYIISNYFFYQKRRVYGFLFLFLSILMSWTWGFILFLFFILILFGNIIYKNVANNSFKYRYLPFCLRTREGFFKYTSILLIPLFLSFIQNKIAEFIGINSSNSNPFLE